MQERDRWVLWAQSEKVHTKGLLGEHVTAEELRVLRRAEGGRISL